MNNKPWDGPVCPYCGQPNFPYKYCLDDAKELRQIMHDGLKEFGLLPIDVPVEELSLMFLCRLAITYIQKSERTKYTEQEELEDK